MVKYIIRANSSGIIKKKKKNPLEGAALFNPHELAGQFDPHELNGELNLQHPERSATKLI